MSNTKELAKSFEPAGIEERWYPVWEQRGYFDAGLDPSKPSFSIQLPPPNITGILHMGHAFNQTVMDSLTRYYRMSGYNTMWLPGTDHAGIATQIVVERLLQKEGKDKRDIGRDAFVERIWEWQKFSGGTILNQMRRLGDSLDWKRLYFTMNDKLSAVVRETFVQLYNEGLIYKGLRLVNWDPKLQSAVSDLEVESEEENGHMWEIRYPAVDGSEGVVVATTRPETLFGDQAVAVHPDDERYKHLVGKMLKLPLTDREIPVIADEYVDKDFGSGCVKITPAHDFNDFEVGKRHNLEMLSVLDKTAHMNENCPAKYRGMDRYECRKAAVEDLKALGLLVNIKAHKHMVPRVSRTGEIVEPMLSEQWYMAMSKPAGEGTRYPGKSIAEVGLEAVESGEVNIFPKEWQGVYRQWLENIQDWCISRQLWWGHRIPAWYDEAGNVYVARNEEEAQQQAGEGVKLTQDDDVLDTWFSSAMVPFSTIGWPNPQGDEKTAFDLYLPSSVLVTGYDIIFFWVIRMVFSGLEQTGECPFDTVLIHGLVRDSQGRKMSKSLGNGIDPLEVIDKYGADALRMTLMTGNAPGNDMRFYWERVEASRNFANKVWNASRFIMMNVEKAPESQAALSDLTMADRWILSKVNTLAKDVTENMDKYELGIALQKVYDFIWEEFCDWYIELAKIRMNGADGQSADSARRVLVWVMSNTLRLLHPFMPFITEEIFCNLQEEEETIMLSSWPLYEEKWNFASEEQAVETIKAAVRAIRNVRTSMNVPPSKKATVYVVSEDEDILGIFEHSRSFFATLGYAGEVILQKDKAGIGEDAVSAVIHKAVIYMPFAELVDIEKEIERLKAEEKRLNGELARSNGMLNNEKFVSRAPEAKIAEERAKLEKYTQMMEQVKARLAQLVK